ncbi:hypothetical protein [Nakamurella sp. PAMC28650]|uniref:hypothetical protein n=1 Tax=Nakamurella sp. PAMC28650 TaxID=2762325 RepID=UPI00351ADE51
MIDMIFPTGFAAAEAIRSESNRTCASTRSGSWVCSANASTGTSPAADTRFSSSNVAASGFQACNNLTESVLPIRTNPVLNKPIVPGQGHFLQFPRRSETDQVH